MGKRSFVSLLPPDVRLAFDQQLIERNFSDYDAIREWLKEKGFDICRSSLAKYGKTFEDRLSTLKLSHDFAIAYKQALPDEMGARSEVLTDLAQDTLFNLMLQLQNKASLLDDDAEDGELASLSSLLSKVTRAIGDINRSSVTVKRYASETKSKIAALADKPGIDRATLDRVNREIFGG
jgi:Protein of unknown function (DUF3486)